MEFSIMHTDIRIAIIGAGAGGLTAAHQLRKLGYRDITLFDKKERVGGQGCTVEINGRSYELGTLVVGIPYETIRALIAEAGLQAEPLEALRLINLNGRSGPGISRLRLYLSRCLPILRCLRLCREQYPYLSRPGYGGIDREDLGLSFENWTRRHDLQAVMPVMASLHVGWGYGYLEEVAAVYVLKLFDLYVRSCELLLKSRTRLRMKFLVKGYQRLWEKIANPFHLRLGKPVTRIHRSEAGIWITRDDNAQRFDQLILACPLDECLSFLDCGPEEKNLFGRIRTLDFHAIACQVENLPPHNLVFIHNHFTPATSGRILSWYRRWPKENVAVFYAIGRPGFSKDAMETFLAADLKRLGAKLSTIHHWKVWKYFPHVPPCDIRDGYYERMEKRQGMRNTYLAGEIMSFSTAEHVAAYSQNLMQKFFAF